MSHPLLEVQNLTLGIQRQNLFLLKKINFTLNHGQTLAVVGESGSGKTLTALAIMQLLPPAIYIDPQSTIKLNNEDLLYYSELKMRTIRGRKIAIIFQEAIVALNPVMTIGEQIIEVFKQHFNFNAKIRYDKALSLLDEVGIPSSEYYFNAYPHELSGGLKQRAMIAIALSGEPDLLIADEPTTALDVTLQAQIIHLLKDIQKKRNMGLIFITHDLGVVYAIADDVIVLYKGEIVEQASAKDFFKHPKHDYSQRLFASLPSWLQPKPRHCEELERERSNPLPLLKVMNLKVYYPIKKGIFKRTVGYIKAVDDISFELKKSQTLALVGESGSGKTTAGMAILNLIPKTQGKIIFNSEPSEFRKNLQVVFQDPFGSMDPRMRILDIIAEGIRVQSPYPKHLTKQIDDLLYYVGLEPDMKNRYPHEFSGGQRQRICIARAIAMKPKLLICDEPTSALDVSSQVQILQLLLKMQTEMGLSYLLITHNLAVVKYMADDVAVMRQGHIVELGPTEQILLHPQHPYTVKLLNAIPYVPQISPDSLTL